jgi:hypothetical protein
MKMNRLKYPCLLLMAGSLWACTQPVKNAVQSADYPDIYPDYVGVTVPSQIAPLNFDLRSEEDEEALVDVTLRGARGGEMHTQSRGGTDLNESDWKDLLRRNAGDSLQVTVSVKREARGWTTYRSFGIHIDTDSIDPLLAYRRIAPGYEVYSRMGIYERDLTSYDERAVLESTQVEGCVNCHAFNRGNPNRLSLHIRGEHGATLLRMDDQMEVYNTATPKTLGLCVYPYWHPEGRYIAYSTNQTRQGFHIGQKKRLEVFDLASDVLVYDTQAHELIVCDALSQDSIWETFPAFSADGKSLYFCSAQAQPIPARVKEVRYNLCRIPFDPATGQFGHRVDTLVNAVSEGKSVSFPRPSFDGRWLMYTLSDYGNFSIWHPEADLWLLDVQSGACRALDEVNSDDTESYHTWSTDSRWVAFSSRRDDGLYTRIYLAHMDKEGRMTKPFMLPQRRPKTYYSHLFQSYNIPEFTTAPVELDKVKASGLIRGTERKELNVRNVSVLDKIVSSSNE